jgi:hypothetical protein
MRFNIAVNVLAQTLPLAAASVAVNEETRRALEAQAVKRALFEQVEVESATGDPKKKATILEKKLSAIQESRPVTAKATISKTSVAEKPLECNPDVGIFACKNTGQCVESKESTLGGFCVTYQKARSTSIHRDLQDGGLCEDIYVDCNCDAVVDGVGSYNCTRPDECIDSVRSVCGTFEDDITVNANGSYSMSLCWTADAGGAVENALDSPISQYCFTSANDGSMMTDCTLEIDSVQCTSCTPVLCSADSSGADLDCSNIDSAAVGNTCARGLNVLALLAGTLTSAPTPAPVASPTEAATESTPSPTSEPTSGASNFTSHKIPANAVALAVALVASLIAIYS